MLAANNGKKATFALLVDPDEHSAKGIESLANQAEQVGVDIIFFGGSFVKSHIETALTAIKQSTKIPVVLFPGNAIQFSSKADAILLLSLISGRNPDYLIGNHIIVSNAIKESGIEVIPTGYMLIESGVTTSVQYMSNTMPIPSAKIDIAVATALAGQQLGLKAIYLEAGSGAKFPVPPDLIREVRKNIDLPIIVGGGLRLPEQVYAAREAGANLVVVGNAIEKNPNLLGELAKASL
jgi:putative glycerol-1-phosphate prenyltransferase